MALEGPTVGLGTMLLKESCDAAVTGALSLGCRLIDTGEHYGNLDLVGAALKQCERKPVLVTKLSGLPVGEYQAVRVRMVAMLEKLGVDRADIVLMHWPGLCSWDPTDHKPLESPSDFKASSWDEFCDSIVEAWNNLTKLKEEGLVAEIGTSNFYSHHLAVLEEKCGGAKPYANEVFIDSNNQEHAFVEEMQTKGIRVFAYRPVIYKPFAEPVQKVSERHGVSSQAVILAWLLRRGVYPLVKCRGDHLKDNLVAAESLKDQLTEEDLADLRKADAGSLKFSAEWFAKIWWSHNQGTAISEEDVQMLVSMGVDEEKARAALEASGGNFDEAMDAALA